MFGRKSFCPKNLDSVNPKGVDTPRKSKGYICVCLLLVMLGEVTYKILDRQGVIKRVQLFNNELYYG